MICIVGLVDEFRVYLGADSCSASDYDSFPRADEKLFEKPPFLIGCTGSPRAQQLLQYELQVEERNEAELTPFAYMVAKFVPALRSCLKDGGFAKVKDNREEGNDFLVAYAGSLFAVFSDFQVMEAGLPYFAIGAGHAYAKGALAILVDRKDISASQRLVMALRAAAQLCIGVAPPFKVLSIAK